MASFLTKAQFTYSNASLVHSSTSFDNHFDMQLQRWIQKIH